MPGVVLTTFYPISPGMLACGSSITADRRNVYDMRRFTYVYLDKAMNMLIVRLLKSLNVGMLPYLESACASLPTVSHALMLIRTVTAASRAYKPVRGDGDVDGHINPLHG